jgi:hypothetical protein
MQMEPRSMRKEVKETERYADYSPHHPSSVAGGFTVPGRLMTDIGRLMGVPARPHSTPPPPPTACCLMGLGACIEPLAPLPCIACKTDTLLVVGEGEL